MQSEVWIQSVYEIVMGESWVESDLIQNEFAENSYCDCLYEEIYAAKCRLNQRLGTAEDPDLELILDRMRRITKRIALKMYDYGEVFASMENAMARIDELKKKPKNTPL